MMELLDPGWAWDEDFPLSQGLRIGDVVVLSGQVAIDENGAIVGKDDIGAQTRQVFWNIEQILRSGSASLSDVVKLTTFFTVDITDKGAVGAYFALVFPDLLLEVEAIAWAPVEGKR